MDGIDFSKLFKTGGLALVITVGFFGIMDKALSLEIYTKISAGDTFTLIMTIISFVFILTFSYIIITLIINHSQKGKMFDLARIWDDLSEIDCEEVVIPDLVKAADAMKYTATAWNDNLISKDILIANHYDDFKTLYNQITTSENIVEGYNNKKCKDFINSGIKRAYKGMQKYQGKNI